MARTPIGKAYPGAFNDTQPQALADYAIARAFQCAGLEGAELEDVVLGCAMQQGATHSNIARQGALRAGLPISVAGMSIDRQCASGLMAVATVAKQIIDQGMNMLETTGIVGRHDNISR